MKSVRDLNKVLESNQPEKAEVKAIDINHKPHPYMVGAKHVVYASDHYGGMLGEETCKAVPCAHTGCRTSYDEHTHDTVLAVTPKCDLSNEEMGEILRLFAQDVFTEGEDFDGFVFVESEFKIGD